MAARMLPAVLGLGEKWGQPALSTQCRGLERLRVGFDALGESPSTLPETFTSPIPATCASARFLPALSPQSPEQEREDLRAMADRLRMLSCSPHHRPGFLGQSVHPDTGDNVIREISGGVVITIAGNGVPAYTGDGGPSANLN
jgi:hypothetical protein